MSRPQQMTVDVINCVFSLLHVIHCHVITLTFFYRIHQTKVTNGGYVIISISFLRVDLRSNFLKKTCCGTDVIANIVLINLYMTIKNIMLEHFLVVCHRKR